MNDHPADADRRHRTWRDLPPTPPLGPTAWAAADPAPSPTPPRTAAPRRLSRRARRTAGFGLLALGAVIAVAGIGAVAGEGIGEIVQTAARSLPSPGGGDAGPGANATPIPDANATPTPTPVPLDPADEQIAATAEKMLPSVVQIETSAGGMGAGFVAAEDGWVLTAAHVVGTEKSVTLRLKDGSTTTATVEAVDSTIDTAVLKATREDLPALELGTSSGVRVGQTTVAVGSPFGFAQTVTTGIVSGLDRELGTGMGKLTGLIQTDAPINPGNSGGPLADREGRVIGINTAIATQSGGSDGVGFAIPIDKAKEMLRKVRDGEWTPADDKPADSLGGIPGLPGLDELFGPNGPLGGQGLEGLDELFGPNGPLGGQGLDDLFGGQTPDGLDELDRLFGPDGAIDPEALERLFGEMFGQGALPLEPPTPDAVPAPDGSPAPTPDTTDPLAPFGLEDLDDALRLFDDLFGGGLLAPDGSNGAGEPTGATR